jgi:ectoine hydroxylase-related dioxygenase (phytanoyl-CoA dioxygenase family)
VLGVLSPDQRDEFERTGLLQLSGVIPVAEANAMADRIWSFLSRQSEVDRHDPATWSTTRPTGFQPVSRAGELDGVRSAVVRAAVHDLIGTSEVHWERPRVLMTFPDADLPWTVPSGGWHFDYVPRQVEPGLRAIQVFVVLDEVLPQGGATLVLAGSHRLVGRYVADTGREPRPRLVRAHLAAIDPWLGGLWGDPVSTAATGADRDKRLFDGAVVDDVPLRVVEATGSAGDVYLMHSDCFHAVAANARPVPRIMATSVVARLTQRAGNPSSI